MHFFKSLTYSPDKPSRQSFTQKRITLLGQAWSAICTYSLALLTLKERVYKSMDHRGAVSFNFFCCTCKCIPATVTCILNILVNIKENCLLNSSWELWFILLYPPFLYQSSHTFSLEVLWGRASCSSWLAHIVCQYSGSIFSSILHSHTGFQIKIYGRYGGSSSLELKMMCLYLLLSEANWLKNL